MNKKAIYTILTTFFFIFVVLFVTLGIIYYGRTLAGINQELENDLNKFIVVRNTRDAITHCYGIVMDSDALDEGFCRTSTPTKNVTLNVTKGLISGYTVEKLDLNNCTAEYWGTPPDDFQNSFVYAVPVRENLSSICLGKLRVYI